MEIARVFVTSIIILILGTNAQENGSLYNLNDTLVDEARNYFMEQGITWLDVIKVGKACWDDVSAIIYPISDDIKKRAKELHDEAMAEIKEVKAKLGGIQDFLQRKFPDEWPATSTIAPAPAPLPDDAWVWNAHCSCWVPPGDALLATATNGEVMDDSSRRITPPPLEILPSRRTKELKRGIGRFLNHNHGDHEHTRTSEE